MMNWREEWILSKVFTANNNLENSVNDLILSKVLFYSITINFNKYY